MSGFEKLKGVKSLLENKNKLKSNIQWILKVLIPQDDLTKKALKIKARIINGLQEQVMALGDKIEDICINANLDLEQTVCIENKKRKYAD